MLQKFLIIGGLALTTIFASGDRDRDGRLNSVEVDDDGDRMADCIEKKRYQKDTDNDGVKNGTDNDDDGDGIKDTKDTYLFDTDNDGVRNDAETKLVSSQKDDDDDGVRDKYEKTSNRLNHDNDAVIDAADDDDDNDNLVDSIEATIAKRNHDNDSIKDKRDSDDDNDGITDLAEINCQAMFSPTVPTASWTDERYVDNGGGSVGRGLAVDSDNGLHAVWTADIGLRLYVNYGYSTDQGASWTVAEDVTNSIGSSFGGNIAIGSDNTIHLAYNVITANGNVVYYIQSADKGTTWSEPIELTNEYSAAAATPSIAVDTTGRIHVAWHSGDIDSTTNYTKVFYTQSGDDGEKFSEPLQLNTNAVGHSAWPRLGILGDGEVVAVSWRDNRAGDDWDAYLAVSTDGGESFIERTGMATQQIEWDPDIVVDRFGNLHLGVMVYDIDGINIYYTRSSDNGLSWTTPVKLSDYLSRFPFWAVHPDIDVLWLFWKDERDRVSSDNVRADVAAKYSLDGGDTWNALDRATDQGDVEIRFPSPALGPDGMTYVLWSDQRANNENEQVFIVSRSKSSL